MRIEQELKLGFKDVLFRPKRSTLKSRSQVNLTRDFTFKHSGRQWSGVPVIAANMPVPHHPTTSGVVENLVERFNIAVQLMFFQMIE